MDPASYRLDREGPASYVRRRLAERDPLFAAPYVVSAVGGGGKTSLLLSLYEEPIRPDRVLTTTTAMMAPPGRISPHCPARRESGIWFADPVPSVPGKYKGPSVTAIDAEVRRRRFAGDDRTLFLCEADGAKRKPLKAYADHEPVIPETTDLVFIVFGLSALGCPFSDEVVHRAEIFADWTGLSPGDPITYDALIGTLSHDRFFKGIPATARVAVVFNQADLADPAGDGRVFEAAAAAVMRHPRIDAVFFTSILHRKTYLSARSERRREPIFSAVVLAAGLSSRMGRNKLIEPLDGEPVLMRTLRRVRASGVRDIVVVTGCEAEKTSALVDAFARELPDSVRWRSVYNEAYETGQGSSVAAGTAALAEDSLAAFYVPGDQPFLSPAIMRDLCERVRPGQILIPSDGSHRGSPVLFDRTFYPELGALSGDVGGRQVIERRPEAVVIRPYGDRRSFFDLDVPEDLTRAQRYMSGGSD